MNESNYVNFKVDELKVKKIQNSKVKKVDKKISKEFRVLKIK